MGKLLKLLGWLIGIVVVLIIAAVILVPLLVDPNDYKDEIITKVKEATGRDLTIAGDIGLSVFPWLGVELNGVKLSNAPGFGDEPFVAVNQAKVKAKLMPLLSKKLVVDDVQLEGLRLNLGKNKKGVSNWDDLVSGEAEKKPKDEVVDDHTPSGGLAGLEIGGISINDARVVWDDKSAGQAITLDGVSLNTGAINPGSPVDLKLGVNVKSSAPKLSTRITLDGTLSLDEAAQKLSVQPLNINIGQLEMDDGLTGEIDLNAALKADLSTQHFVIDELVLTTDLKGGSVPGDALNAKLSTSVVLDLAKEILNVTGLKLDSGDLHLSGDLNANKLLSDAQFDGSINIAEFSLRKLMTQMGMSAPETSDPKVLEKIAINTKLKGGANYVALNGLSIRLDDTKIKGNAKISNFAKPAISFKLNVDDINADRYLPPPTEGEATVAPAPQTTDGNAVSQELFPVETLRGLDINGVLSIGKLIISKIKIEAAEIKVKAKDGHLKLDQKIVKFYQGNINGNVVLDVRGKTPTLHIVERLNKIQAGPLVKDVMGEDRFDGRGGFNADITAKGQSIDAIKKSLNGKLDFIFENGSVKGFNVAQILRETKAKFSGKKVPASNEPNQTDFSELQGSAVITNGVLNNQDFLAKSPFLRINGKGIVDLGAETLDYVVKPVIVSTTKGQGGAGLDDLKGVPIPIHLTGAWASPGWEVDWKSALTASQKVKLKEKKKELKAKVDKKVEKKKEKLKKKLEGKLKGLF